MLVDYTKYKPGDKLIMSVGPELVTLTFCEDGLFRDDNETIYGFEDSSASVDEEVRLGVGNLSLPEGVPINGAAVAHDYSYASPAYQAQHDRSEADLLLKKQITELGKGSWWGLCALPFYWIARSIGNIYWENKNTRGS